jgi:hypothetical protein
MIETTHTNGVHHATDEMIDSLYAWMPGTTPAPAPCPEALFSCTLKGKLDGIETLLTVRGMTAAEFRHNLQQIRGLLDQPQPAPQVASPGQDKSFCAVHQVAMTLNDKNGRQWYSHQVDGQWCKGRG